MVLFEFKFKGVLVLIEPCIAYTGTMRRGTPCT